MDGTYAVTMGDRGRLVVPAELRERAGLSAGTPLILVEGTSGLAALELVGELLAERRRAAAAEDTAA